GRKLMGSDAYFDLGLGGGRVALLDQGVRRPTRKLFVSPGSLGQIFDCAGHPDCVPGRKSAMDDHDHGTKSAAILTGNDNSGPRFRGVTETTLDVLGVYTLDVMTDPAGKILKDTAGKIHKLPGLDSHAAKMAFQKAVAIGHRVIVAEMQGGDKDHCGD